MTPDQKLNALLLRAKASAEKARQQALKIRLRHNLQKRAAAVQAIADDYTRRLVDKARFRALLADSSLDAERFRFYFSHFGNDLDTARAWIDQRMSKEKEKVENAAS